MKNLKYMKNIKIGKSSLLINMNTGKEDTGNYVDDPDIDRLQGTWEWLYNYSLE